MLKNTEIDLILLAQIDSVRRCRQNRRLACASQASMPSWFTRLAGYPTRATARPDTWATFEEGEAAAFSTASFAVADGGSLRLRATPSRRVALLIEPSPFTHTSGYSNRFKKLIQYLQQAGDQVLVIVPDDSLHAPTQFAGARIVTIPGFRFPLYRRIMLTLGLRGVYSALRDFNPDVIHVTTPGFFIWSALLYARLLCKPLLVSYHTHLPIYTKRYGMAPLVGMVWTMLRIQHNLADFTLTTSPQLCEELIQNGFKHIGLWRKGMDTDTFHPKFASSKMRARLSGGNPDSPLIIYVGRLGAEKGLEIFESILKLMPDVRLGLVGDGPARRLLERRLDRTRTVFMGILHGDELSSAFASADVFVMPSASETLGFVALESMACGVPVVGANAGGIPDIVQDTETGFLFEPGDVSDCVRKVQRILTDSALRARMSVAARTEACKWTWEASIAATRNIGHGRAVSNFARSRESVYRKHKSLKQSSWFWGLSLADRFFEWTLRHVTRLKVYLWALVEKMPPSNQPMCQSR